MTRVTNFGRKRTYLEAGLSTTPGDAESDPTPDAVDPEQAKDEAEVVTDSQPLRKKSKKNKKKKKVEGEVGEVADAAGPSQLIQPKKPAKSVLCLFLTGGRFLTDSTRSQSQRASGVGVGIEAAKAYS